MLVLDRKCGQVLEIGEAIAVKVLSIAGGHVKLGITAPAAVTVLRGEVRDRGPGRRLPAVGRRIEKINGAKPRA